MAKPQRQTPAILERRAAYGHMERRLATTRRPPTVAMREQKPVPALADKLHDG